MSQNSKNISRRHFMAMAGCAARMAAIAAITAWIIRKWMMKTGRHG